MNDRRNTNIRPVREGEEFDVKIENVGEKGDGIARVKGFVVFVPKTKTGDEVRIRITRVLNRVGFGEVVGESSKPVQKDEEAKEESSEPEESYDESMDSDDFGEDQEQEEEPSDNLEDE